MRIAFVNQSLVLTGGLRVVLEHSARLKRRGHEVSLLAPRQRLPFGSGLGAWKYHLYERFVAGVGEVLRGYGLRDAVERFDPSDPESVPASDAIVATAWRTAEWVHAMPERVGRRYYLIQQYEAWSDDIRERVDRTWALPLRRLVIAHWLERLAMERFGQPVLAFVPNGVDPQRFQPASAPAARPVTVGMLYDLAPWKGADDGLAALWALHRADPALRFVLFGRYRMRHALPPGTRYVRNPPQAGLPDVYRSMDVFVNSSHSEGFSLVTLEAMACGCALAATAVGELPEMGRPGEEYLMVPPREPAALADAVLALTRDPARRRAVADAGTALARRYTWDHATDLLEQALKEP